MLRSHDFIQHHMLCSSSFAVRRNWLENLGSPKSHTSVNCTQKSHVYHLNCAACYDEVLPITVWISLEMCPKSNIQCILSSVHVYKCFLSKWRARQKEFPDQSWSEYLSGMLLIHLRNMNFLSQITIGLFLCFPIRNRCRRRLNLAR